MITYLQANRIIQRAFGNISFVTPSTMWLGLSTTTINSDGTGATEPVANNYSRVSIVNDATQWGTATNGVLYNIAAFTFPQSSGSWGTITYMAFYDAASTGNILFFDTLSPSRTVASSTTVLFAIGAVAIQMNNT
jgi:hypothetical protein